MGCQTSATGKIFHDKEVPGSMPRKVRLINNSSLGHEPLSRCISLPGAKEYKFNSNPSAVERLNALKVIVHILDLDIGILIQ